VEVHEPGVRSEGAFPRAEASAGELSACRSRAEVGRLLGDLHSVRAAEEGEQVVWIVGQDGVGSVSRQAARQECRHGRGRLVRRSSGVSEPVRVASERREVREQHGIDVLARVFEGRRRHLVEDDHHHGHAATNARGRNIPARVDYQVADRTDQKEEDQEDQRSRGQNSEERLHLRLAAIEGRDSEPHH
jgi:hypothetical protein